MTTDKDLRDAEEIQLRRGWGVELTSLGWKVRGGDELYWKLSGQPGHPHPAIALIETEKWFVANVEKK